MKTIKVWFPTRHEPEKWLIPDDAKVSLGEDRVLPAVLGFNWTSWKGDHSVRINLAVVAAYEVIEDEAV